MIDLLPDLAGRPDWVAVVVFALAVAGTIGVRWVTSRNGRSQDEDDQETDREGLPSSQGSDVHTTAAITKALDLLANEAVESQGARAEAERLRADLLACSAERDRLAQNLTSAQAELDQCNRECRRLAMRALEKRGDSGD